MASDQEKIEREERAKRLKWARERAGFSGPVPVSAALNINVNRYKAHEQGRNGFGIADARAYARLFKVSLPWLYMDIGKPDAGPKNSARLREIFERLDKAPEDVQAQVISYAEFKLASLGEKSLETDANPAS